VLKATLSKADIELVLQRAPADNPQADINAANDNGVLSLGIDFGSCIDPSMIFEGCL